jgi:hypothetical protein
MTIEAFITARFCLAVILLLYVRGRELRVYEIEHGDYPVLGSSAARIKDLLITPWALVKSI